MPQSPTQICNSALTKIGGRSVTAFGDVDTKEAELVTARLPVVMGQILRSHVWSFMKKVASITSVTDSTLPGWGKTHVLPADCLRILSVSVENHRVPYEIMGTTLHTNYPTILLRYVRAPVLSGSSPPTDSFPDDFSEVVACYLAADICVSLTQDDDMRSGMLEMYEGLLRQARFNGAVELSGMRIEATEWIESRFYYPGYDDRSATPLDVL